MLPLNNLLLPELPASDNPLKISNLLPPEATVPDASFGDLLTANLIELTDPALPPGDVLPLDGNAVPLELAEPAVEPVLEEFSASLPEPPAVMLQPELPHGEPVKPVVAPGAVPTPPADAMPENLPVATGAEQLLRVSPQPVATAAVDIAPPEGLQAQQQPRAVPAAVEAQVAMQQARGAPDSVVPRVLDTATMQQALSRDTGEQRRENPSDTAEKLPLSFLASRSAVDNDAAPPRGFETSRDDAMQSFRTLQQLNQQVQQPQQAPSPAMPAITAGSAIAANPAPAPLPPAGEALVSVNTPVTDASWGEQIGERVVLIANRQLQNAEIRLSPAELGPLRVQVRVDDGATNITFHATHAVTRDAIEQAMPRLREMFLENGLNLGEANVSEQGMGPQADTGREAPGQAQADSAGEGDRLNAEALESAPETRSRRVIDGLVDTFV